MMAAGWRQGRVGTSVMPEQSPVSGVVFAAVRCPLFAQPIAVAADRQHMTVVQRPIEDRGRYRGISGDDQQLDVRFAQGKVTVTVDDRDNRRGDGGLWGALSL
jgi:hypothetical protein